MSLDSRPTLTISLEMVHAFLCVFIVVKEATTQKQNLQNNLHTVIWFPTPPPSIPLSREAAVLSPVFTLFLFSFVCCLTA